MSKKNDFYEGFNMLMNDFVSTAIKALPWIILFSILLFVGLFTFIVSF